MDAHTIQALREFDINSSMAIEQVARDLSELMGENIEPTSPWRGIVNNICQKAGIRLTYKQESCKGSALRLASVFDINGERQRLTVEGAGVTLNDLKDRLSQQMLDQFGVAIMNRLADQQTKKVMRYTHDDYWVLIEKAQAKWPQVFSMDNPLPLHKGARYEMAEGLGLYPLEVSMIMKRWCKRYRYLTNVTQYKHRYRLDGTQAESITEPERAYSARLLKHRDSKNKAKPQFSEEQQAAKQLYNAWSKHWPDIFSKEQPKPLNMDRVKQQLHEATGLPLDIIETTLKWWTHRYEYHRACESIKKHYCLEGLGDL